MALHIAPFMSDIEQLANVAAQRALDDRLEQARALLRSLEAAPLDARLRQVHERIPWLVAFPVGEPPGQTFPPPAPPPRYTVVATDGSHMAPDRHSPVRYVVLNIGWARLHYGPHPRADLGSEGHFWYRDEDLHVQGRNGILYPLEGARLGTVMALKELEALAEHARDAAEPVVALRDGSLIFWPLQSEEAAVQEVLIPRIRRALRAFHDAGIPVASYISYPGSRDLVNSLRVWICGHCRRDSECGHCTVCTEAEAQFCYWLRPLRDQVLLQTVLRPGERSALFRSASAVLDHYRDPDGVDHRVYFFYVHTGTEIARVEVPAWVAQTPAYLDRVHAVVVDQCRRGQGYPPVLQEAHEEAVITASDRETVHLLVEEALAQAGLAYEGSAKAWSKRVRGV